MYRFSYPLFLDISSRLAVVVGGGSVARRKTEGLLAAGARVRVVAPEFEPELETLAGSEPGLELARRGYEQGDLEGAIIAFAATSDRTVNAAVAREARQRGILVCVVDRPLEGDFAVPAVLRRGPLAVAVSTSGSSPAVARLVRQELTRVLGSEYGELLELAAEYRRRARIELTDKEARRRFLRQLGDPQLLELLRREGPAAVRAVLEESFRT